MGARKKLNQAYVTGALVIAAVSGLVTQSWGVFWLVGLFLVASSLYAGEIRLDGRRK